MRPVSTFEGQRDSNDYSKCRKPICKQHAQTFVCNACTTPSEL
nr:unnamed protein product [Callosobruchus analis]